MINFECDYAVACAPQVMDRLVQTNMEQTTTYGKDEYCKQAERLILGMVGRPEGAVYFFMGGTIANATAISFLLKPYQGVLCTTAAHINGHEAGAIEAGGNKVLALPTKDGKLTAQQIEDAVKTYQTDHAWQQLVEPGMVYISHASEYGTLYSKAELEEISAVCHQYGLPLYLDGARLGYGLMGEGNDITLYDLGRLCDMFYIGGTKQGAMFGEAMVICNSALKKGFSNMMRHKGGVLAKGRVLGLQFLALLENGLYFDLAKHANEQALRIRAIQEEKGAPIPFDSRANQQFIIASDALLKKIEEKYEVYDFGIQEDGNHLVRFSTSWYTKEDDVTALVEDLRQWL
ncbi:MAG TPA: aminotransferase class I/II-fold pyridoxal phosphate-dependent enzyme [Firmicutes bacterium]|nr:aminotransferase class I/II-fold pyridoxal phosphate-dependent enzyme [Bacillota bacterium]